MKYYIINDGVQQGPFELEELPEKGVRPSTYVWCKGMPDWEKAEDVADICRLYRNRIHDLMHPQVNNNPDDANPATGNQSRIDLSKKTDTQNLSASPTRFDKILEKSEMPPLPTIEEIDNNENTAVPPVSMVAYAWIVTLLFFPPTGIAALVFSYKSIDAWKRGENKSAYDYNRAAKMWVGVSFFLGIILYAFLFRFFWI